MVSHIPFKNWRPIINIVPMQVTTKIALFTKSSGAVLFYITLVDGSFESLRGRIPWFTSTQTAMMGKTKPFGPHWGIIWVISSALIIGPFLINWEMSSLKQLWTLPSGAADSGRPNLILVRMAISEFANAFQGQKHQIPPAEKIKGMT